MAKKFLPKVYIALWMVLLLSLGIFYAGFAPRDAEYTETENRTLAAFPQVTAENLFSGQFSPHLGDSGQAAALIERFAQCPAGTALFAGSAAHTGDDLSHRFGQLRVGSQKAQKYETARAGDDQKAILTQFAQSCQCGGVNLGKGRHIGIKIKPTAGVLPGKLLCYRC